MRLSLSILTAFLRSFSSRRPQSRFRNTHLPNIFERRDSHIAARSAKLRAARSIGRIRNQLASNAPLPSTTTAGVDVGPAGQRAHNHVPCNEGRTTRRQRQHAQPLRRYSHIIVSAHPTHPNPKLPGAYTSTESSSLSTSLPFKSSSSPDSNDDEHLRHLARQKIFYDALYEGRQVLLRAAQSPHVLRLKSERARLLRERKEAERRRRRAEDAEFARLLEEDLRKAQAAHWKAQQEEEFARLLEEDMRRAEEAHRRALAEEAARKEEEERRRREQEEELARLEAARVLQLQINALRDYEDKWTVLRSEGLVPQQVLGFGDVPWPVFGTVESMEDITLQRIGEFMFHAQRDSVHAAPQVKSIRQELLRWHPDKFRWQVLDKVRQGDRKMVGEAVETVARILTQLNLVMHDR
jgi:hypothetical protein